MENQDQLLQEQKKREQAYNAVAETVIGLTPWGKFYGLMKMASDAGEGMLKHQVCVDRQGRILKVYKSEFGKWVGAFIRPAHEHATKEFARGDIWRGIIGLTGHGWIPNIIEQKQAKCLEVVPNEFLAEDERRKKDPSTYPPMVEARKRVLLGLGFLIVIFLLLIGIVLLIKQSSRNS